MKESIIYYFSGTHWDREWYQTFQAFRLNLVDALDLLLDTIEKDERYRVFHLDGQTIVLDDYLQIRPEREEALRRFIREGRILIGPWYTMPDEQIVSGESLIRNLVLGHEKAESYGGKAWKCGYVCDIFGHIAQMPQIFNGFGIDTAVLGRGTNQHRTPTFFNWKGGGNSVCTVYKLPEFMGYGSFSTEVIGEMAAGEEADENDPVFLKKMRDYIDREFARNDYPVAVIWDAMDHEPPHPKMPEYMRKIAEAYPNSEVACCDLLEMFARLPREKLPEKRGELIESGKIVSAHHHVLRHVLSSRIRVKQANDRAEQYLRDIEAYGVIFSENAGPIERYTRVLWEMLLQNHAHDSICGCSRDRIHSEMFYRFSQVESFYEAFCSRMERKDAGGMKAVGAQGGNVCVVNPLPMPVETLIVAEIPFAQGFPTWHEPFGYEEKLAFRLYGEDGKEIPYAFLEQANARTLRFEKERTGKADIARIAFRAQLNAMGKTNFCIKPSEKPVRAFGSLFRADRIMENERLGIRIGAAGEVSLADKASGKIYENLITFADDSEIGDGWNSVRNLSDIRVFGAEFRGAAVLHDSPSLASVELHYILRVPERVEQPPYGMHRSEHLCELDVSVTLTLLRDDGDLRVRVVVDNKALDHRLRMRVQGPASEKYIANQAFAFVERDCRPDAETEDWKERDWPEKSHAGIVLRTDEEGNGMAVFSKYGLRECSAENDGGMLFTLLRSFSRTHTSDGEPGGQEQGKLTFNFLLRCLHGKTDEIALQNDYDVFKTEFRAYVAERRELCPSPIETDGKCCVSAVKRAADESGDLIVRCYNPSGKRVRSVWKTGGTASEANMLEQPVRNADAKSIALLPGEIKTIRIQL